MLQGQDAKYERLDVDAPDEPNAVQRPCNDIIPGLLFLGGVGSMAAAVVVNHASLTDAIQNADMYQKVEHLSHTDTMQALAIGFGTSILFAVLWILFMRSCVRCAVYTTFSITVLIEIAAAGGVFYMAHDTDGHWSQRTLYCIGVVVCLVLLYTLYLGYSLKNRVDLCANMVKVSGIALKSSPCVFVVALAMVCLKFAFAALCTSAMWVLQQSTLDYWFVEHKEWTSLVVVLMGFWGLSVLSNLLLVTLYGALGRWYYGQSGGTFSSLARGCSTSFGSICFGSLLVASLQTAHTALSFLQKKGFIPRWFMCLINYLFGIVEAAIEQCNKFGFVQVAVQGLGFTAASKRAMSFLKYKGLTAVLHETILSRLQSVGSFAGGLLSGFVAVCACHHLLHVEMEDKQRNELFMTSALLGWYVIHSLISPMHSVATALLVCFAEAPEVLASQHPDEYATLLETWTSVYGEEFVDKAATIRHDKDPNCINIDQL